MNLDQNRASIAQRLYALFSGNNNYTTFSNNAAGGSAESVESLHDTIHSLVGGFGTSQSTTQPGHMAYIQWSAFDPIFFLHHCMVDRIMALWQTIHPDTWVPTSQALLNSYTTRRGQYIDATTPLTPFFSNSNGTFWTSDGVRDHTKFGYTYAELLRGPSGTSSNEKVARVNAAKQAVNRMYGSFSPASLFLKELRAQQGTGFATSHKAPHHSLMQSKIFAGGDGNDTGDSYHEWTASVRVGGEQALPDGGGAAPSAVVFFLGGPVPDHDDDQMQAWASAANYVGTMGLFTAARSGAGLGAGEPGMAAAAHDGVPVSGSVPLTAALVGKVETGELASLAPVDVEPYLRANLKRVVLGNKGEVVGGKQCPQGMSIRVVNSVVAAPWSEEELPRWGEATVGFEMC
jgi:tyrosinase